MTSKADDQNLKNAPAPNPFELERLALKGDPGEGIGVKRALVHVPVRKPNRHDYIRTHPVLR